MTQRFKVEFLEEVDHFLEGLDDKTRTKILYNIRKAQVINDNELFKKLIAFWDKTDKKETLIISTHGIEKKTAKTPSKEIKKTEEIMKQYFAAKK
ncbi:type II toxin-antitoxin system RelE/ParE family toxin [Salinimicrobium xinjiangense]|uniref:toxin RelE n=1 Tax=Salinimicrobium xinjiangense TaxID=438596 RepID=UPI0003F8C148|nr:toxin RelE [Salinimicrobium xinjiangense]